MIVYCMCMCENDLFDYYTFTDHMINRTVKQLTCPPYSLYICVNQREVVDLPFFSFLRCRRLFFFSFESWGTNHVIVTVDARLLVICRIMIIDRVLCATIALEEYSFPMSFVCLRSLLFVFLLFFSITTVRLWLDFSPAPPSHLFLFLLLLLIMFVDDDTDRDIVFSVSRQRQFPVIFLCWCFNRFCKCIK